jgi:integrase
MSASKTRKAGRKLDTVTIGNVTVKIYQRNRVTTIGGKRTVWEVSDYTGGLRQLHGFNDFTKARSEAERIAGLLATGQSTAANLCNADAAEYGNAVAILRNANLETSLQTVADRYVEAVKILGAENIIEAAKDFVRRNPVNREPRTVQQVADEIVALKKNRKASVRYIQDLRARLNTMAKKFSVNVDSVTTSDLQTWFDGMDTAPRTVRNFRNAASALFKFAEARGFIAKGENPVTATERIKSKSASPIEIYSPKEIRHLLDTAPDSFRPIIAIQAFAGLRSAEAMRLHWQDVKLKRGHIEITARNAKTASRRIVPILTNLAPWLKPYARKTGLLFKPSNLSAFNKRQNETADAAGIGWKANALRHSFISYRVADIQDVAQVALEAGNSPGMIFGHYRELVTADDAKKWFSIQPQLKAVK